MGEGMLTRIRESIAELRVTQRVVAQKLGMDESKLTKSLAGRRQFRSIELALLAEVTGKTVDWFLTGVEPRSVVFAHRVAAIEADPTRADTEAKDWVQTMSERRYGLELIGFAPPAPSLPARPAGWSYVAGSTKLAAAAIESMDGAVHSQSNRQLIEAIEKAFGVDVVVMPLPGGVDGMSYTDGDFRSIVLGTSTSAARQRWTLAHELGHIMWGDAEGALITEQVHGQLRSQTEKRADSFAAHFLVPRAELVDRVHEMDGAVEAFDRVVCEFGVSPEAMAWRMLNEELVSAEEQQRLRRATAGSCARNSDWVAEHMARNQAAQERRPPLRLALAAVNAWLQNETTIDPVAQLLNITRDEAEESFPPGDDERDRT